MGYENPKVTIDLEEYNALLKAKNEKYDPDEVASLAATMVLQIFVKPGIEMTYLRDGVCENVDYNIDMQVVDSLRYAKVIAKVTKKPIR